MFYEVLKKFRVSENQFWSTLPSPTLMKKSVDINVVHKKQKG